MLLTMVVQRCTAATNPLAADFDTFFDPDRRTILIRLRNRRQSHPAATVARFSADRPNGLPEPIDYLTPPRPPETPVENPPEADFVSTDQKWDLGYDPSDILNPPSDPFDVPFSERTYGTLNGRGDDQDIVTSSSPSSSKERINLHFETENAFEPTSAAIRRRQTESEDEGEGEDEDYDEDSAGRKSAAAPAGPVYTFVKTDKHGHYKWGVRHGHLMQ